LSYLFQNCALIDDASVDYNLEIPLITLKKVKNKTGEEKSRFGAGRVGFSA
jgi:putative ABC transport system ATP-binding protein